MYRLIPRVGSIEPEAENAKSAENICNFKIVIIMYWGYHHAVKVDRNNAREHVWTFAGGFIYFVICEGTAVTQGVAPAWLWLYKGFVQHSGTVWRAEPMMGLQKSRSADICWTGTGTIGWALVSTCTLAQPPLAAISQLRPGKMCRKTSLFACGWFSSSEC